MATAGYKLQWGKGYRTPRAGKEPDEQGSPEGEAHQEGSNVDEEIHGHLQAMHKATGHGHSHVQHHPDGSHTSHHISHDGEISGPHHHPDGEAMAQHMAMQPEGGGSMQGMDEQEAEG